MTKMIPSTPLSGNIGHARLSFTAILALLALTACVPSKMHRPVSIEEHPGYALTFIEFDDQGELWTPSQLDRTLARIELANRHPGGALVIVYVHGWNNDAAPASVDEESNVGGFERILAQAAAEERRISGGSPRPIVGIYIGWRGRVSKVPLLNLFSFYNRRNAALRIAGVSATEVLYRITTTAKQNPETRNTLLGHSFGGLILERALSQALVGDLLDPSRRHIAFPADLVVLINPATQSMRSKQFIEMLDRGRLKLYRTDAQGQRYERPLVVSITSSGDWATRVAFPVGLTFSSLTKRFRPYGADYCGARLARQRSFFLQTPGHQGLLLSHEVIAKPLADSPAPAGPALGELLTMVDTEYDPETRQRVFSFDGEGQRFTIRRRPLAYNDTPYWILRVPPSLIPDHSTIFGYNTTRLIGVLLRLTGALESGSTTTLVREDGVRPLGLGLWPSGRVVFLDRSLRLYEIDPETLKPIPLSCLPPTRHASDRIGLDFGGRVGWAVVNRKARNAANSAYVTEILRLALQPAGMDLLKVHWLRSDRRFVAAAVDRLRSEVYLATPDGEIYRADLRRKRPEPRLLARPSEAGDANALLVRLISRRLVIADGRSGTVRELDLRSDPPAERVIARGLGRPAALAFDDERRRLYVSDSLAGRLWVARCEIDRACSAPRVLFQSADVRAPSSLVVDPAGRIWVGDAESQRIVSVHPDGTLAGTIRRLTGGAESASAPR